VITILPNTMSGAPPKIPKGNIILVRFPYTDFSAEKLRPALVLYEGYLDITVAYITGQIPTKLLPSDLLISPGTPSFTNAGLKENSVLSILSEEDANCVRPARGKSNHAQYRRLFDEVRLRQRNRCLPKEGRARGLAWVRTRASLPRECRGTRTGTDAKISPNMKR
jgi:hypothetical protein